MRTKILVLLSFALVSSADLHAQVSIGELAEPASGALLDLNKAVKGGLALSNVKIEHLYEIPVGFPGISTSGDVTAQVKQDFTGAMVYHTGENGIAVGIYVWNGTNWTPVTDNCLPAENLTLTLTASSIVLAVNVAETFTVSSNASARCADSETYAWSIPGANIGDYVITPLSTSGDSASIRFITAGTYTVKAEAHNSYSTGAATAETTVFVSGVPESMKASGYYLTGKPCYDINKSDTYDSRHVATTAAARIATATDFSDPVNRTRTYMFCHDNYTNLSVSLWEDNGGLVKSISQPAGSDETGVSGCKTFTVTFKDNVEALVNGSGYSVKLLASFRDKSNQAKLADMDISVLDGLCGCPAKISSSDVWLTFQCHNLGGLDILTGSEAFTYQHHGDWYRWGAKTASLVNIGTNDGSGWTNPDYQATTSEDDSGQQDTDGNNLWKAENNPCPAGWRLPTNSEWQNVVNNNSWPSASGWTTDAFNAVRKVSDYLYLPAAGYRSNSNGSLSSRGNSGYYWSSSSYGSPLGYSYGQRLFFFSGSQLVNYEGRAFGYSVRCVAAE
ncbi:MAG: hypothetical protein LBP72_09755 [Dysgonamonadaceae bacterium]|jgi:uncharacterized protein (TIGR02145 family)|nr:hypothetical protein [Dysgonamonadaceae bacterium]